MARYCSACGKFYDDKGFGAINGGGENIVSSIEIYDNKYYLCPECTHQVYNLILKITKESRR